MTLAGLSPCGRRLPSPIMRDSLSKLAISPDLFGGNSGIGGSGKDAVDEPARRRVAGQAGAEQPEAPPVHILDPVIVADRARGEQGGLAGVALDPPLLGDA